jgi:hypothetical protein
MSASRSFSLRLEFEPFFRKEPFMLSDAEVQQWVYSETVRKGRPPRSEELAVALGADRGEVLEAFRRLNGRRLLVLAPESGEITMAPPFSASPTSFFVTTGQRSYFANCVCGMHSGLLPRFIKTHRSSRAVLAAAIR